jgi:hypothetical protein
MIALAATLVLLLAMATGAGAEALDPRKNQSATDAEKVDALLGAWERSYINDQWYAAWATRFPNAGLPKADDITREAVLRAAVELVLRLEWVTVDDLFYFTPEFEYQDASDTEPNRWGVSLKPLLWMQNEGLYQPLNMQFDAATGQCIFMLVGGRG